MKHEIKGLVVDVWETAKLQNAVITQAAIETSAIQSHPLAPGFAAQLSGLLQELERHRASGCRCPQSE